LILPSVTSIILPTTNATKIELNDNATRCFSSEQNPGSRDNLLHILNRETDEEICEGNNKEPEELSDLKSIVEKDWRIVESSSGTVKLYKIAGVGGMKVALQFHCQDTMENPPFDDEDTEEQDMEESGVGLRFAVCLHKGGKNVVVTCISENGVMNVENVTVRDAENVEEGLVPRFDEDLYQGPQFSELADDLQEAFALFLQEECGIDESIVCFVAMYADYKEQLEYVNWLRSVTEVIKK